MQCCFYAQPHGLLSSECLREIGRLIQKHLLLSAALPQLLLQHCHLDVHVPRATLGLPVVRRTCHLVLLVLQLLHMSMYVIDLCLKSMQVILQFGNLTFLSVGFQHVFHPSHLGLLRMQLFFRGGLACSTRSFGGGLLLCMLLHPCVDDLFDLELLLGSHHRELQFLQQTVSCCDVLLHLCYRVPLGPELLPHTRVVRTVLLFPGTFRAHVSFHLGDNISL
mmetsp:Transcript_32239/g.86343  ORF Transcript_32239/g.86343 Transcript_32239/m.86343 type:complete len:221 (-) Transcript_32239:8-670(-)